MEIGGESHYIHEHVPQCLDVYMNNATLYMHVIYIYNLDVHTTFCKCWNDINIEWYHYLHDHILAMETQIYCNFYLYYSIENKRLPGLQFINILY